jgi:hypothetical protein
VVGAERLAVAVGDEQRVASARSAQAQVGAVAVLREHQHVLHPRRGRTRSSTVRAATPSTRCRAPRTS